GAVRRTDRARLGPGRGREEEPEAGRPGHDAAAHRRAVAPGGAAEPAGEYLPALGGRPGRGGGDVPLGPGAGPDLERPAAPGAAPRPRGVSPGEGSGVEVGRGGRPGDDPAAGPAGAAAAARAPGGGARRPAEDPSARPARGGGARHGPRQG